MKQILRLIILLALINFSDMLNGMIPYDLAYSSDSDQEDILQDLTSTDDDQEDEDYVLSDKENENYEDLYYEFDKHIPNISLVTTTTKEQKKILQNNGKCKGKNKNVKSRKNTNKNFNKKNQSGQCGICKENLNSIRTKNKHIRKYHRDKLFFDCPHLGCLYTYHEKCNRDSHFRIKHKSKKDIECTHCDKPFITESKLIEHMQQHKNDNKFRCLFALCDKSFLIIDYLDDHIKRQHLYDKVFICKECERSFINIVHYKIHIKAHNGEFYCQICDKQFCNNQWLRHHMKRHE